MKASVSLSYISEFHFLTLTVVATPESDIHSLNVAHIANRLMFEKGTNSSWAYYSLPKASATN